MGKKDLGGRVGWHLTTLILLGDMLGLGGLAMPSAYARLGGIIPGTAVLLLIAVVAMYSASLYSRLMAVPLARERGGRDAQMLDEVGGEAMGRAGRCLVYIFGYLLILLVAVLSVVTSVENLQQVLHGVKVVWDVDLEVSRLYCTLAVVGSVLLMAQIRKLKNLGGVSFISAAGMLGGFAIALLKLLWIDAKDLKPKDGPDWLGPAPLLPAIVAAMDVLFSYSGQEKWPRYIVAMRRPRKHFASAANIVIPALTACLAAIGIVGYWRLGNDFDTSKPLTSVLRQDGWAVAMNVGVLLHCVIAATINLNTWVWSVMAIYYKSKNSHNAKTERPGSEAKPIASNHLHTPFEAAAMEEGYAPLDADGTAGTDDRGSSVDRGGADGRDGVDDRGSRGGRNGSDGGACGPADAGAHMDDPERAPLISDDEDADDIAAATDGDGEAGKVDPDPSYASRWPWLGLTTAGVLVAGVVAYVAPFFSEVMGLVGAVADVAVMMTLPALFALKLLPKHQRVPRWECWLLKSLVVVSVAAAAVGCTASVMQMHRQLQEGNA